MLELESIITFLIIIVFFIRLVLFLVKQGSFLYIVNLIAIRLLEREIFLSSLKGQPREFNIDLVTVCFLNTSPTVHQ